MINKTLVALCAALTLVSAGAAQAAVLYAEGSDLSGNLAQPTNVGSLALGSNVISGKVDIYYFCSGTTDLVCFPLFKDDEADSFAFSIGGALRVVSATLTISNFESQGAFSSIGRSFTDLGSVKPLANGTFGVLPLGADLTGIQNFQVNANPDDIRLRNGDFTRFNWSLDIVTEARRSNAVPLPGSLSLSLGALAALAWVGRRTASPRRGRPARR